MDAEGTAHANGNRTWFYFAVGGARPGQVLQMRILCMNKQTKLYAQGMEPIVALGRCPGEAASLRGPWHRACTHVATEDAGDGMNLFFRYQFPSAHGEDDFVYFAFCHPHSYSECQQLLASLDERHARTDWPADPSAIYYHREVSNATTRLSFFLSFVLSFFLSFFLFSSLFLRSLPAEKNGADSVCIFIIIIFFCAAVGAVAGPVACRSADHQLVRGAPGGARAWDSWPLPGRHADVATPPVCRQAGGTRMASTSKRKKEKRKKKERKKKRTSDVAQPMG